jgi:hypothetical protein
MEGWRVEAGGWRTNGNGPACKAGPLSAAPLPATRYRPPPTSPSPRSLAASIPALTALCACFTTFCATCCARATTLPPRFDERLLVRLLLRPLLREEPLRLPDRLDADLLEDFRPPPLRDEAERADDPPRFRADFRPRFAPPDFRDDPLLPDFLRDPRLVAAIPVSPDGRSYRASSARFGRDGERARIAECGQTAARPDHIARRDARSATDCVPRACVRTPHSAVGFASASRIPDSFRCPLSPQTVASSTRTLPFRSL